jgi:hypothetical protein
VLACSCILQLAEARGPKTLALGFSSQILSVRIDG